MFLESEGLNQRAGNSQEGIYLRLKAYPEATSRTPRGVRLFKENRADYSSDSVAYASTSEKLGCSGFTLQE